MSAESMTSDNGSSLVPLVSNEYEKQGKVREFLRFPDMASFNRFKEKESVQDVFHAYYDSWVKPAMDAALAARATGGRGQREKQAHFKAVEMVLIDDDKGPKKFRSRSHKPKTYVDGIAYALSNLIMELEYTPEGSLYQRGDVCLHAKRCMAWTLLKHMTYEETPSRKAKAAITKANKERKEKAAQANELQRKAREKVGKQSGGKSKRRRRKRRKGNEGDDLPGSNVDDEDDDEGDDTERGRPSTPTSPAHEPSNASPAQQDDDDDSPAAGPSSSPLIISAADVTSAPTEEEIQLDLEFTASHMADDADELPTHVQATITSALDAPDQAREIISRTGPLSVAERILAERTSDTLNMGDRFWQDKVMANLVAHYGDYREVNRILTEVTSQMRDLENEAWQRAVELQVKDQDCDLPKGFLNQDDKDKYVRQQKNLDNVRFQYRDAKKACRELGLDPDHPRFASQPGPFEFKFWQPPAIYMIQKFKERGCNGMILGDNMGLGKTIEYLGFLMKHIRDRQSLIDGGQSDKLSPPRPCLLVTLPSLMTQVKRDISKVCGDEVEVHEYHGGYESHKPIKAALTRNHPLFNLRKESNARVIILTTYRTLASRHGPNALKDYRAAQGVTPNRQSTLATIKPPGHTWPSDLGGLIEYCFADECNAIKNHESQSNNAVCWLEAFTILVSGTAEGNRAEDTLGLAKIIEPSAEVIEQVEDKYDVVEDPTFDPYDEKAFPDDTEIAQILRLKYKNVQKFIGSGDLTTKDPTLLGKRLASLYAVCQIKRSNVSEIPGKGKIGDSLTSLTRHRLHTKYEAEEQKDYDSISAGPSRKLVKVDKATGEVRWNFKYLRRLLLFSQWTGYRHIHRKCYAHQVPDLLARDDLLDHICTLICNKTQEAFPDDDIQKVAMLLQGSPKARALLKLLRKIVVQNEEKVIIFCSQPAQMPHIMAILRGLQIDTLCYHAGLSSAEKDKVVDTFNTHHDAENNVTPRILLTTSVLAGIGLNLQAACHQMIFMDPPLAQYLFDQACCRCHRLGQQFPVKAYVLVQRKSFNEKMVNNTLKKAAPALMAYLNKDFNFEIGKDLDGERTVELGDWVKINGVLISADDPRFANGTGDHEVIKGFKVLQKLLSNQLGATFEDSPDDDSDDDIESEDEIDADNPTAENKTGADDAAAAEGEEDNDNDDEEDEDEDDPDAEHEVDPEDES